MGGQPTGDRGPQAEDVAAYVATMAGELKDLVGPYELRSLAYLLDLVRLEAEERARGHPERPLGPNPGGL